MKYRQGIRSGAAALALILALAVPVRAELLTGQADLEQEILTGTADLEEYSPSDAMTGEAEMMLLGLSEDPDSIRSSLDRLLAYMKPMSENLTVDSVGGEWSVLLLARNDQLTPTARANYLKNLTGTLNEEKDDLKRRATTDFCRIILAVGALGLDPADLAGTDLTHPLANFTKARLQGINGPAWTLIAIDSRDYSFPQLWEGEKGAQSSRETCIRYLLDNQLNGGGWALGSDSDRDLIPDDMCPMVIQALAPYYNDPNYPEVRPAVDKALERWSGMQTASGGFGEAGGSGKGGSEPISQTILALAILKTEAGVDHFSDGMFEKEDNSLIQALMAYQLPGGGFCHNLGQTEADAMSTDQAGLAMTAYLRAMEGRTHIYDVSDVPVAVPEEVTPGQVRAFREKLAAIPGQPCLDHREAVLALNLELSQMGDFPEKEHLARQIQDLMQEMDGQQKVLDDWYDDIKDIKPSELTLSDRPTVEALRQRYNAIPRQNRKYLKFPHYLIELEERLLELDNSEFPLAGQKKTDPPKPPVSGGGQRVVPNIVTESNTQTIQAEDGMIKAQSFASIQGKDRNLRVENKLDNGKKYVMTFHGMDLKSAGDFLMQIDLGSPYAGEIGRLAEDAFIFHFENEKTFPAPAKVELPVDLEDGLYLLLCYDVQARKAQYIQKVTVDGGVGAMVIDRGGHYFLAKKAISKSLDELDAMTQPTQAPTEAPVEETEPPVFVPTGEAPAENRISVDPWIAAGAAALTLALAAMIAVIWMKNRKGD